MERNERRNHPDYFVYDCAHHTPFVDRRVPKIILETAAARKSTARARGRRDAGAGSDEEHERRAGPLFTCTGASRTRPLGGLRPSVLPGQVAGPVRPVTAGTSAGSSAAAAAMGSSRSMEEGPSPGPVSRPRLPGAVGR
jgi:hypothetical protein